MARRKIVPTTARERAQDLERAVTLLQRCYEAMRKEGWQEGVTIDEVCPDVRIFLDSIAEQCDGE